jgi:hypothetical protein
LPFLFRCAIFAQRSVGQRQHIFKPKYYLRPNLSFDGQDREMSELRPQSKAALQRKAQPADILLANHTKSQFSAIARKMAITRRMTRNFMDKALSIGAAKALPILPQSLPIAAAEETCRVQHLHFRKRSELRFRATPCIWQFFTANIARKDKLIPHHSGADDLVHSGREGFATVISQCRVPLLCSESPTIKPDDP